MRFAHHTNCSCVDCQEKLWPDDPDVPKRTPAPDGEQRCPARRTPEWAQLAGHSTITIDGRDVTDDVFDFVTGAHGWVALYSRDTSGKRRHLCPHCRAAACSHVERGHVRVQVHAAA